MINYTTKIVKSKELKRKISKYFEKVEIYQRKRKFTSNKTLANLLIHFIATRISLFALSVVCVASENLKISDTSFKKLFQKCDKFKEVYENLLNDRELNNTKTKKILGYKQCFLLDTTNLAEEGQKGEVYRIHSSYAITKNQISSVNVTDSHTAESVTNFDIKENSLYLADRAYCTAMQISHMIEHNADFIFRMRYNAIKLYTDKKCTKRFDVVNYLSNTQRNNTSKTVYIKHTKKIYGIKMVAKRLNENVANAERKASMRKAQNRGSQMQPDTLKMCEWLILLTSLTNKSNESILKTYRLRWQIELLFKRFKTFLNFHRIRKSSKNYAFSYIFLALICFFALELFVEQNQLLFDTLNVTSTWTKFAVAFSYAFGFPFP